MLAVAHNLSAMNSQRQFNIVDRSKAKSIEKLSSGYKINRAADDAAGLAISEKMRRQIRGLDQAKYNIQDGIGICQTRDGALDEVHGLLQRMNELSVKSANGTLSEEDRSYIQEEVDQITDEINRIGKATTFNEIPIFDYNQIITIPAHMEELVKSEAIGTGYLTEAYKMGSNYYPAANLDFSSIDSRNISALYDKSFKFTCSASCSEAFSFKFINGTGNSDSAKNLSGAVTHTYEIDIHNAKSGKDVLDKIFSYVGSHMPYGYAPSAGGNELKVSHTNLMIRTSPTSFSLVGTGKGGFSTEAQARSIFPRGDGMGAADVSQLGGYIVEARDVCALAIQAGAEAGQKIYLTMNKMNAKILGVDPLEVSTQDDASAAIAKVKSALNEIANQRADAGAEQNRLEHAYKINDNIVENTTSAESVIRDTDMAKEMVEYSLKNILAQAGTSMMAQANQANSNVLALLQ